MEERKVIVEVWDKQRKEDVEKEGILVDIKTVSYIEEINGNFLSMHEPCAIVIVGKELLQRPLSCITFKENV